MVIGVDQKVMGEVARAGVTGHLLAHRQARGSTL